MGKYAQRAGAGAGFPDEAYVKMGAQIVETAKEKWEKCDFLAKVKEIEPSEYGYLRKGQMIYCCIHPAGHPEEVQAILDSKCIAITAEDSHRYGSPNCEASETLPMLLNILNNGLKEACVRDGFIRRSLTAYEGYLTHEETSAIQNRPWIRPEDILEIADRKLDPAPPATTTRSDNFITCK